MATADPGIGKDPTDVDAEQPDERQVMDILDEQTEETKAKADPDVDTSLPSREELWQVVQTQQKQIDQMAQQIDGLEQQVDEVEFQADTIEEVAEQFRNGKIGGPAGATFLAEFVSLPDGGTKIDARAKKLFFRIIEERRVGDPVTSKHVVRWLGLQDSANPSVNAKRIMERVERHRQDGFLIGSIELGKYRGQNCIWLNRE